MALFSTNITIKFQSDVTAEQFTSAIQPGTSLNSLFRGELAILSNDEGISLYTLDGNGEVTLVRPRLEELADIEIENPQPGEVIIYNNQDPNNPNKPVDYPGRPVGKWINVPAPRPNLSGNSIFEIKDVVFDADSSTEDGYTLVWEPVDPESIQPGQPVGYWKMGQGVSNSTLNDYADVQIDSAPIQGQTLVWNDAGSYWENGFYPAGLNDLLDVDLETVEPVDGDVLLYDGSQSKWVPGVVTGGNANVEIITDEANLPVAPLGTLGVKEKDDNGDYGDFYWIQKDNTNDWAKAAKAGEVSFGDFKDIDITGIQPGQGLRWTYTENGFKFVPTDLAPIPYEEINEFALTRDVFRDSMWEERGYGLMISTYGQDKGRYYTTTTATAPGGEDSPIILGMYGTSADGLGIHVDRSEINKVYTFVPSNFNFGYTKLEDDFNSGFLRFPDDLVADEKGLLGIRPVTAAGSIPWTDEMRNRAETWNVSMWIRPTSFGPCTLLDYGTVKVELINSITARTTWWIEGVEYTRDWTFWEELNLGEWYQISFGRDYRTTFNSNGETFPELPNAERVARVEFALNQIRCVSNLNEIEIRYDWLDKLDEPDVTTRPLPVIGEGFTGSMAVASFSTRSDLATTDLRPKGRAYPGLLPVTDSKAGQLVGMRYELSEETTTYKRLCTFGYNPETWGVVDPGVGFSSFGSDTNIQDLADFDKSAFDSTNSGYLFYDASMGKFTVTQTVPQFDAAFTLGGAEDVEYYDDNNQFIQGGQYLRWDGFERVFKPASTNLTFKILDAEDVDISGGLENGQTLIYDETSETWKPGTNDAIAPPALNDLSDVEAGAEVVADKYTLLYSEAGGQWYAAPAPSAGANRLTDLTDVDDTGIKDGEVLAWNALTEKYEPSATLVPTVLDDLEDVNTVSRPPRDGQALQWNGSIWAPGDYLRGGASSLEQLYDVSVTDLKEGQGLVWGGTYWENRDVASGQGDGGDFETGVTRVNFTTGVWGGGDFDTTTSDKPVEQLNGALFRGGGDFF